MATAKTPKPTATRKTAAAKPAKTKAATPAPRKVAAPQVVSTKAPAPAKRKAAAVKSPALPKAFTAPTLAAHLSAVSGVEPKATRRLLLALEQTILQSVDKKGPGGFTLPGLLKVTVERAAGGEASFKTRALKKLKVAAA